MPTPTYTAITSQTLASNTNTVIFNSIPGTYRDLILVCSIDASAGTGITITFNSDTTGGNYTAVNMIGTGSAVTSATPASSSGGVFFPTNTALSTTHRTFLKFEFFDYSATDKHKTFLTRFGNANTSTSPSGTVGSLQVLAAAQRWGSTSAITSITISGGTASFDANSVFSLYGVVS